jgi:hypothetical protein
MVLALWLMRTMPRRRGSLALDSSARVRVPHAFVGFDLLERAAMTFDVPSRRFQLYESESKSEDPLRLVTIFANRRAKIAPTHLAQTYGRGVLGCGRGVLKARRNISASSQILREKSEHALRVLIWRFVDRIAVTIGRRDPQLPIDTRGARINRVAVGSWCDRIAAILNHHQRAIPNF